MAAPLDTPLSATLEVAVPPVAALECVSKRYRNGVTAVDNLSLALHPGEVVALLGPNGAGKSTAIKLLMGLGAPTSGTVRVFGKDPRYAGNRLRTGVMLQVGRAPDTLKVHEHLELFRGYYPHPFPAAELVRLAGLEGMEDRLFGQLSGGGKQRVLFALALAGNPDLVFLDEPTVGLDIEARRGLWKAIRELAACGKTVLLSTHYLEEADALASRIVVIAAGRVVCEGTPSEIKAQGADRLMRRTAPPREAGGPSAHAAPVKVITCVTALRESELLAAAGVAEATVTAGRATLISTAPETTLRALLDADPTLGDLLVIGPALEDAFLALTAP